jgi:hypothetical protein
MRDGDYHDIWLALVFAVAVVLAGKLFLGESDATAGLVLIVAFTGGTLIMDHIAARERRKQAKATERPRPAEPSR